MPTSKPSKPAGKTKNADPEKKPKPVSPAKSVAPSKEGSVNGRKNEAAARSAKETFIISDKSKAADANLAPFLRKQKERLVQLRDAMLDSMMGVAKDTLRSRAEGSEASAFGMHQADAGSDAYDRDFALSLLSQEQDALYEIEEALKRIELGTYGTCEM
ncbi:MAG: molecular chaperone DnaK, partial [Verrucomicrobiota bacterium]|nr:molecular chaperone DnaK [Verrucomicrobiota bacterium]